MILIIFKVQPVDLLMQFSDWISPDEDLQTGGIRRGFFLDYDGKMFLRCTAGHCDVYFNVLSSSLSACYEYIDYIREKSG